MKNNIERFYTNELYSKDLIDKAIEDYKTICDINIKKCSCGWICVFHDGITDLQKIVDEFSNYLIELGNDL